jgi:hypothetical protein
MSNLDKLRVYLGIVGGQQSMVLAAALKRLKEQDDEIATLQAQLTGQPAEGPDERD